MRLLHTLTLQPEQFLDPLPPYAILSHRWGDDEVKFDDLGKPGVEKKAGFAKIAAFCTKAASAGFQYGWVDTCCIDKRSSSELTEAINSMFQWYKNSAICYAHLADVSKVEQSEQDEFYILKASSWFLRGWTLQELLAPKHVVFLDKHWSEIGTKVSLKLVISRVTGIGKGHLKSIDNASVAQKMSWASERQTTRPEDMAYCLLGLFDVSMPLLYGEGMRAFQRLQEEIIKNSDDETIFAWAHRRFRGYGSLLAPSPEAFQHSRGLRSFLFDNCRTHFYSTNKGLRLVFPCFPEKRNSIIVGGTDIAHCLDNIPTEKAPADLGSTKSLSKDTDYIIVPLNCRLDHTNVLDGEDIVALRLARQGSTYVRTNCSQWITLTATQMRPLGGSTNHRWCWHHVELVDLGERPPRGLRLKPWEVFLEASHQNSDTPFVVMIAEDADNADVQLTRSVIYDKRAIYARVSSPKEPLLRSITRQEVVLRNIPQGRVEHSKL